VRRNVRNGGQVARDSAKRPGGNGDAALMAAFVTLIPLSFSDQFLNAAYQTAQLDQPPWVLLAVDTGLLTLILMLTLSLWRRVIKPTSWRTPGWWVAGALLTLALDAVVQYVLPNNDSIWINLAVAVTYVASLTFLLAAIVGASPLRIFTRKGRDPSDKAWVRFRATLPLLIGTVAAYVGSIIWSYQLDNHPIRTLVDAELEVANHSELIEGISGFPGKQAVYNELCRGAIDQQYFAQLSQVIPLLLVALAFEARFVKRLRQDSVAGSMAIVTVIVLCIGEVLAITALPVANRGCNNVLHDWYEYLVFIVTLTASVIALAALLWSIISLSADDEDGRGARVTDVQIPRRPLRRGQGRPRRRYYHFTGNGQLSSGTLSPHRRRASAEERKRRDGTAQAAR
jgi:hypothetical protein